MVDLASPASSRGKYSGGPAGGGRGQRPPAGRLARADETRTPFILRNPSVMWFLLALALFTLGVTVLSEATGIGLVSTSFVKTLGKTLCLCLVAIAMDVVWGYCGILSLGHMAFFAIGGYAIGMWLMYARTEIIVTGSLMAAPIPPTDQEIVDAIGTQIFGVVGSSEFPWLWAFADSLRSSS
jgi:urea transport system permease protein